MSATNRIPSLVVFFCALIAVDKLAWAIPSPVNHVHTGTTVHWNEGGTALPWTNGVANGIDHNHLTTDNISNNLKWDIYGAWDNRTFHHTFSDTDWAHGQIFDAVRYGWVGIVPAAAKNGVEAGFGAWVTKATAQYNLKKDPWDVLSIKFARANAGDKEITVDFVEGMQEADSAYADFSPASKTIRFETTPTLTLHTTGAANLIRFKGVGRGATSVVVPTPWSYDGTPEKTATDFEYSINNGVDWTDVPPIAFPPLTACAGTCDTMIPAADKIDIFEMDFRTIADHEIGHAIGLNHTGSKSVPIMRDDIADKASFGNKMAIDNDSALAVAIDYTWSKGGAFMKPDSAPTFDTPTILVGEGKGTGTLQVLNEPEVTKTENGYKVSGLSYKVTATSTDPIEVKWDSEREFVVTDERDVKVRVKGGTTVTPTGGEAEFFVTGTLDGVVVTEFKETLINDPTGENINWNEVDTKSDVTEGDHILDMHSGFLWYPNAVGDMITVSSVYDVEAVPEPSTLILVALGSLLLFARNRYRRVG